MRTFWPEHIAFVQVDAHLRAVRHADEPSWDCYFFVVLLFVLEHLVDAERDMDASLIREPYRRFALDWHVDAHRESLGYSGVVVGEHADLSNVGALARRLRLTLRATEVA